MSIDLGKFVSVRRLEEIFCTVIKINAEIGLSNKESLHDYALYDRRSKKISNSSGRIYLVTEAGESSNLGAFAHVRELHTLSPITFAFGPVEGYSDAIITGPYIRTDEIEVYDGNIDDLDLNMPIDKSLLPTIDPYNNLSSVLSVLPVVEREKREENLDIGCKSGYTHQKEKENAPIDYHSLVASLANFGTDYPLRIEQARAGLLTNDLSAELQSAKHGLTTLRQSKFRGDLSDFITNRTEAIAHAQKLLEDRLKGWRRAHGVYIPSAKTIYAFSKNNY